MATHDSLINDSSLRAHPDGVALSLQIPWYRSLWLSSVNDLTLAIDGETIPQDRLRLQFSSGSWEPSELTAQTETLWFLQERPLLIASLPEPLALGTEHDVDVTIDMTIVYMQIKPGMYVPNRVSMQRHLTVVEAEERIPPLLVEPTPAPEPGRDDLPFKLGLTLYSATAELAAGQYDLDSLLARVADAGVGPGIEIVASQMLPTYPVVTEQFAADWRATFDKYGFEPSSFGANLDMGRNRTRDMNPDEEFEFTRTLFEGAKKLGFPLVRIQSAKPDLLRRLIPLAEALDLKMGYEIHAPSGPNTPNIQDVRDTYAEFDSPLLGFVADFSATMHAMSPTLIRAVRKMGLDDEAVATMQRIWASDQSMFDQQNEFIDYLRGRDFDPARLGPLSRLAFNMHGHVPITDWAEIMPQILHVHAKFYDIDAAGEEPAIDYPGLVREFLRGGYTGYWSSEWEGHAFADLGEVDPIALVRKQHDLIVRTMRSGLVTAG